MFLDFFRGLAKHSARHLREGLKSVIAGAIGAIVISQDLGFGILPLLGLLSQMFLFVGVIAFSYEILEYIYERPEEIAEDQESPPQFGS